LLPAGFFHSALSRHCRLARRRFRALALLRRAPPSSPSSLLFLLPKARRLLLSSFLEENFSYAFHTPKKFFFEKVELRKFPLLKGYVLIVASRKSQAIKCTQPLVDLRNSR
jgi:hypothetical protein